MVSPCLQKESLGGSRDMRPIRRVSTPPQLIQRTTYQTVFVSPVIDGNLDAYARINKSNDSGWYSNEIGVTSITSSRKTGRINQISKASFYQGLLSQCLVKIL